jgi:radical SAM superfamily enzyme YgiQ (UPF0313 family)
MHFKRYPVKYEEPLFRPPSEANSLIFQVTIGCAWNRCSFCEMYSEKTFRIKKEEDILHEIEAASKVFPDTRRIFLADGNPMVLSANKLLRILSALNENFPRVNRISTYALPSDIISKTPKDLIKLKEAGLKLIYVGIESGDDEVLLKNNKSETFQSTVVGLLKAKAAGIKLSVMILSGLGGKEMSIQHAKNSARIVNAIQPEHLSVLVLSFPFGPEHYQKRLQSGFEPTSIIEQLKEVELFISETALESTVFRSNHASNYLELSGVLGRDKNRMLEQIRSAIVNPEEAGLRPEWLRGL